MVTVTLSELLDYIAEQKIDPDSDVVVKRIPGGGGDVDSGVVVSRVSLTDDGRLQLNFG